MRDLLRDAFGGIFQNDLLKEMETRTSLKKMPAGSLIMDYGKYIKSIPLVISGAIKIIREDSSGHELFLYHLSSGDTCAMSMTCCMNQKKSEIRAIVDQDATLVMVPVEYMDDWMRFSSWRQFVFMSYNLRLEEMLGAVDALAFTNLDERLMNYLLDIKQISGSFEIVKTHQEIASDLGTSRVVISRLLKKLSKEDKIEVHRNRIEIL